MAKTATQLVAVCDGSSRELIHTAHTVLPTRLKKSPVREKAGTVGWSEALALVSTSRIFFPEQLAAR